jgi:hypothetical protein
VNSEWLNDGEPDDNGDYIAVITNAAGARISTFKGKTYKEVADQLLKSQANANREISRLRRPDTARVPPPMKTETRELTPADKLRLSTDITDPDKVVQTVTEIVTHAQGGVTPRDATKRLADMTDNERDQYYRDEAVAFVQATPDYYPVQQNRDKLFDALKGSNLDLTRNNLALVFQTLFDQGEMIAWPTEPTDGAPKPNGKLSEEEPSPEPNPPSPTNRRPRSISTGIRSTDASATAPPPPMPRKLTRADIERMPRAEYMERLKNPAFRRQVDEL